MSELAQQQHPEPPLLRRDAECAVRAVRARQQRLGPLSGSGLHAVAPAQAAQAIAGRPGRNRAARARARVVVLVARQRLRAKQDPARKALMSAQHLCAGYAAAGAGCVLARPANYEGVQDMVVQEAAADTSS